MARGRVRAGALLVVTLALLLGCGDSGGTRQELKDGRAAGPGFAFTLPKRFEVFSPDEKMNRKLDRALREALPTLDQSGLLRAGFWVREGERSRRAIVNVVVEPITADTSLDTVAQGALALLRTKAQDVRELPALDALGSEPAAGVAYTLDDLDSRGIMAKRGSYAYTLTVQMPPGNAKRLDELARRAAASWEWEPLDGRARARLAPLARARGTGWATTLPSGWRATDKATLERAGQGALDGVWRGFVDPAGAVNVNIAARPLPGDQRLDTLLTAVADVERRQLTRPGSKVKLEALERGQRTSVDGEPAGTLELRTRANGLPLRQREVVTQHDGRLYRITLTSRPERFAEDARALADTLARWRWTG